MARILVLRGKGEPSISGDVAMVPILRVVPRNVEIPPGDYLVVMSAVAADAARPHMGRFRCVICVGPATAAAVGRCAVPRKYSSEGVVELLSVLEPGRVVVVRSDRGSGLIREGAAHRHEVIEVAAYSLEPRRDGVELARRLLPGAEVVAVTSGEVARTALAEFGEELRRVKLVAIGPEAAKPLIEAGLSTAVADRHTLSDLITLARKLLWR